MSRWLLIGIGVGVWSLASGLSGLAPHLAETLGLGPAILFGYAIPMAFVVMLLTRCCVGLGEAVYGPVAPDVISDLFPVSKRGQVLAWFYAAIPFGGAMGYALGALILKATKSDLAPNGEWRYAFYLVVPPGLLLAAWCLFMPEPPRGKTDAVADQPGGGRKSQLSDYWFLLRIPSYSLNTAGMTFMCFAMGGLAWFAPAYLKHREVPDFLGMDPVFFFGVLTAVLGLIATIVGGLAGDALRRRHSGSYFLVSGAAMCLACPMLLLMVELPFPLAWLPMGAFTFLLFFNTGPTNTISANVVHPVLRSRGFAFNILLIHLFGDAASPIVLGWVIGGGNLFDQAFRVTSVVVLVGGLLWLWGAAYLQRDTERAPRHLPESPA
jgi:MFS family permease